VAALPAANFQSIAPTLGVVITALIAVVIFGDWSLVPTITVGGKVVPVDLPNQYMNALRANRDLCFSIAAAAFALWSHWQGKISDGHSAACDDFHESYGERTQACINGLRNIDVEIALKFKQTSNSAATLELHVGQMIDLFMEHMLRLQAVFREVHQSARSHLEADQCLTAATECEDKILASLNDLRDAVTAGDANAVSAALPSLSELFAKWCLTLDTKYRHLRKNPPH
jgi:hypothetical protein